MVVVPNFQCIMFYIFCERERKKNTTTIKLFFSTVTWKTRAGWSKKTQSYNVPSSCEFKSEVAALHYIKKKINKNKKTKTKKKKDGKVDAFLHIWKILLKCSRTVADPHTRSEYSGVGINIGSQIQNGRGISHNLSQVLSRQERESNHFYFLRTMAIPCINALTVSILGWKRINDPKHETRPYTMYRVEIYCLAQNRRWVISRRYRDFYDLRKSLLSITQTNFYDKKFYHAIKKQTFPSRQIPTICGLDQLMSHHRVRSLEAFLQHVMNLYTLTTLESLISKTNGSNDNGSVTHFLQSVIHFSEIPVSRAPCTLQHRSMHAMFHRPKVSISPVDMFPHKAVRAPSKSISV